MQLRLAKDQSNQEISHIFAFVSGVLDIQGANPYKVAAYRNAAAAIASLNEELKDVYKNPKHDFDKVPSIGERIASKLDELFKTGNIKAFQKYVKNAPAGSYQLALIQNIGVKTAFKLAKAFKLPDSDKALEIILVKAQKGEIQKLEDFGEKREADLIEAIQAHTHAARMPYMQAKKLSDKLIIELKKCPSIQKLEVLGSLRRQTKTIGDIDIGLATNDIGSVKNFVKNMKTVKRVLAEGDNVIRLILQNNIQVDLKLIPPKERVGAREIEKYKL